MGGWELIIALFGGAWYVISAISAANEKKKKKAKRKMALEAESLSLQKGGLPNARQNQADSLMEKSKAVDMISEALPNRETQAEVNYGRSMSQPAVAKPNVSGKEVGVLREARKAILDSMRKELGLPAQTKQPPQQMPIKVPAARPPKPAPSVDSSSDRQMAKPRRRPRPAAQKPVQQSSEQPSGQALAALLKKRSGLKHAMVLSEIFQPPVSLRSQHLS